MAWEDLPPGARRRGGSGEARRVASNGIEELAGHLIECFPHEKSSLRHNRILPFDEIDAFAEPETPTARPRTFRSPRVDDPTRRAFFCQSSSMATPPRTERFDKERRNSTTVIDDLVADQRSTCEKVVGAPLPGAPAGAHRRSDSAHRARGTHRLGTRASTHAYHDAFHTRTPAGAVVLRKHAPRLLPASRLGHAAPAPAGDRRGASYADAQGARDRTVVDDGFGQLRLHLHPFGRQRPRRPPPTRWPARGHADPRAAHGEQGRLPLAQRVRDGAAAAEAGGGSRGDAPEPPLSRPGRRPQALRRRPRRDRGRAGGARAPHRVPLQARARRALDARGDADAADVLGRPFGVGAWAARLPHALLLRVRHPPAPAAPGEATAAVRERQGPRRRARRDGDGRARGARLVGSVGGVHAADGGAAGRRHGRRHAPHAHPARAAPHAAPPRAGGHDRRPGGRRLRDAAAHGGGAGGGAGGGDDGGVGAPQVRRHAPQVDRRPRPLPRRPRPSGCRRPSLAARRRSGARPGQPVTGRARPSAALARGHARAAAAPRGAPPRRRPGRAPHCALRPRRAAGGGAIPQRERRARPPRRGGLTRRGLVCVARDDGVGGAAHDAHQPLHRAPLGSRPPPRPRLL